MNYECMCVKGVEFMVGTIFADKLWKHVLLPGPKQHCLSPNSEVTQILCKRSSGGQRPETNSFIQWPSVNLRIVQSSHFQTKHRHQRLRNREKTIDCVFLKGSWYFWNHHQSHCTVKHLYSDLKLSPSLKLFGLFELLVLLCRTFCVWLQISVSSSRTEGSKSIKLPAQQCFPQVLETKNGAERE